MRGATPVKIPPARANTASPCARAWAAGKTVEIGIAKEMRTDWERTTVHAQVDRRHRHFVLCLVFPPPHTLMVMTMMIIMKIFPRKLDKKQGGRRRS